MEVYIVFTHTQTLDNKELETYHNLIKETTARFPNADSAKKWHYSNAYQKAAKHRQNGALYDGILVAGNSPYK